MGLFNKIKNILFEEDEVEEIPVYSTEKEEKKVKAEPVLEKVEEKKESIKSIEETQIRNIKRDIDMDFDDDVLDEIPRVKQAHAERPEVKAEVEVKEEKKSPFLSFDEDEFERLNSRINKNENKIKRDLGNINSMNSARKANNNFSATSTNRDNRRDPDRYKITDDGRTHKKMFTPSPVISPVYGILNKNYTKEDIVDRKDGMKRERVKPIVRPVEEPVIEENIDVDIDSVRKKAYGAIPELEKAAIEEKEMILEKVSVEVEDSFDEIETNNYDVDNEIVVEDTYQKDIDLDIDDIEEVEEIDVVDEDEEIEEVKLNTKEISKDEDLDVEVRKPKALDDLEKTSTLQILDDIERELNSIKPITEEIMDEEEKELSIKEKIERSETLENDLFDLIDSMYEEGEEDEDND